MHVHVHGRAVSVFGTTHLYFFQLTLRNEDKEYLFDMSNHIILNKKNDSWKELPVFKEDPEEMLTGRMQYLKMFGAMHFIYYINRLIACKVDSIYLGY